MTYRPIPGYEGRYYVNETGSVLSECRPGLQRCLRWGRHGRYPAVRLAGKLHRVHRLVLLAFRGPRPSGCDASHLNDNPLDNRLENLVWEPHRENCRRRKPFDNKSKKGEESSQAKLTEAQARSILALKGTGRSACAVGREFGITDVQVGNIWKRRSWRHLACT